MKKFWIYIISPYTQGNQEDNVTRQAIAANCILDAGHVPIWPLSSHFLHTLQPRDYEDWMSLDMELLSKCDLAVRLPGESPGGDREEAEVLRQGKKCFQGLEELTSYLKGWNIEK